MTKAQAKKRCKEAENKLIAVCSAFPLASGKNYANLAKAIDAISKIQDRI